MRKKLCAILLSVGIVFGAVSQTSGPMDLVVLLDTSASMSGFYEETSEYLIGPFLREFLRIGDTFHLISFSGEPRLEISRLVEGVGDVETIIGRILLMYPLNRNSDAAGALNYAEKYAASLPGGRHRKIILISDGDGGSAAVQAAVNDVSSRLGRQGADLQFIKIPLQGARPSSGRPAAQPAAPPPAQTASTPGPSSSGQAARPSAQGTPPAAASPAQQPAQSSQPAGGSAPAAQTPQGGQTGQSSTAQTPQSGQTGQSSTAQTPQSGQTGQPPAVQTPQSGQNSRPPAAEPAARPSAPQETPPAAASPAQQPAQTGDSLVQSPQASGGAPADRPPQGGQTQALPPETPAASGTVPSSGGPASPETAPASPAGTSAQTTQVPPAVVQPPVQTRPVQAGTAGGSGEIPFWLIVLLIILALFILGLIIFFIARNLHGSPNRAMAQAASAPMDNSARIEEERRNRIKGNEMLSDFSDRQKSSGAPPLAYPPPRQKPMPKDKPFNQNLTFDNGPPMLSLWVEDQNTAIGRRNIHAVKPGYTFSVGGGKSDFLIFLVPVPPHIADVAFDGHQCTFIPRKPQYFPDIGGQQVPNCIGKTIKVISDKNYQLHIRIERYEDPLKALNTLLHSIDVPN